MERSMKKILAIVGGLLLSQTISAQEILNRLIDYAEFENQVAKVGELRRQRRVTEDEFIEMSKDSDTVTLDARSARLYAQMHVKGATNLSFPDVTADELAKIIPRKSSRILIYCNNNFLNASDAFPAKSISASLNIHTVNMLYSYGYKNFYELGPLLDVDNTKIQFEGLAVKARN
jgi:phage shock protein E